MSSVIEDYPGNISLMKSTELALGRSYIHPVRKDQAGRFSNVLKSENHS